MIRFASLAAASAILFQTASAERVKTFTVDIVYDAAAVRSPAGADAELASIVRQARAACRIESAGTRTVRIDRACLVDVVSQAVSKIDAPALTRTYADSPVYVAPSQRRVRVAAAG